MKRLILFLLACAAMVVLVFAEDPFHVMSGTVNNSVAYATTNTYTINTNVTPNVTNAINIVATNVRRVYLRLENNTTNDVYIALGTWAATNSGIHLAKSGGTFELTYPAMYRGPISAFCGVNSNAVLVFEGSY